jgi:hypothetical protein
MGVGAGLLSAGLLAQAGGAILFFAAAGAGVFAVLLVPGLRRWVGAVRGGVKAGGPLAGAAVSPVIVAAASVGILLMGAPHAHARRSPHLPEMQEETKGAEAIVQTWKIRKDRLFGEMDVRVRGVAGDSFMLLNPPAVLTGFQGDGLDVTKVQRDGKTEYFVVAQRDGVLTGHATFEMPVGDFAKGIPVATGAAAVQRVTVQLDQAGWEFTSAAAVSVTPLGGLAAGQSGATLVLGPAESATINLNPKRRDAATEVTQFFAELANLYIPGPGVVNGSHYVTIRPAQGRVSELEFTVPPGFTVGEVHNGPVGEWPSSRRRRSPSS